MMNNGFRPHIVIFIVGIAMGISIGMLSVGKLRDSYSPTPLQFPDHEAVVDGTIMPAALMHFESSSADNASAPSPRQQNEQETASSQKKDHPPHELQSDKGASSSSTATVNVAAAEPKLQEHDITGASATAAALLQLKQKELQHSVGNVQAQGSQPATKASSSSPDMQAHAAQGADGHEGQTADHAPFATGFDDKLYDFALREHVPSLGLPADVDSADFYREKLRERDFRRMHRPDAPWLAGFDYANDRMKDPLRDLEEGLNCNPLSHSCACLKRHLNDDKCSQIAHRQKPEIQVTVGGDAPSTYLDCPSVRCHVRHASTHSNFSKAYIKPVGYVMKAVVYNFPPKTHPEYNKNVLYVFESHARYPKQLWAKQFYSDIDAVATNAPTPETRARWSGGVAEQIHVSYANLPAAMYRNTGPSFSDRSDKISFFVSNCKQVAAWRGRVLEKISQLIPTESFGAGRFCDWPKAKHVSIAKDWPQCNRPTIKEYQERRYAEKECVLRNSRVSFVLENSREDFYATEKLYQALYAGVVPVYMGAPNIRDILPHPDAAILIDDFANLTAMVEYVDRVNHEEALFHKHTAWKKLPFSDGFLSMLRTEFSLCTVCEHYAAEAKPSQQLPSVQTALPQCVLDTFVAASNGQSIPVNGIQVAGGVDAVFVLVGDATGQAASDGGGPELGAYNAHAAARQVQAAWGASPVIISDYTNKCADHVGMCTTFAGHPLLRAGTFPCLQHAFAAYLTVIHGLQNALVVGGAATLPAYVSDKARWTAFLSSLPPDYDAADLGTCAGQPRGICSGAYLLSQKGARKVLRGDTVDVVRGPAA